MAVPVDSSLVSRDTRTSNWPNENPVARSTMSRADGLDFVTKSSRCPWPNRCLIPIGSILFLLAFVSLALFLRVQQHMNDPDIIWPEKQINWITNETTYSSTDVKLPYQYSHHTSQYNIMILKVWLTTCLVSGCLIAFTLMFLIFYYSWEKRQEVLKQTFEESRQYDQCDDDRFVGNFEPRALTPLSAAYASLAEMTV